jgi:hypothetical protein
MKLIIMIGIILLYSNVLLAQYKIDSLSQIETQKSVFRDNFRKSYQIDGLKMKKGGSHYNICNLIALGASCCLVFGTAGLIFDHTNNRFYLGLPLISIGTFGFFEYFQLTNKWEDEIEYYNSKKHN